MKRLFLLVLLAGIIGATKVLAQGTPPPTKGNQPPAAHDQVQQFELRNRSLDIQAREEKLRFEREMNNIRLEQERGQLERQKQPPAGNNPGMRPMGQQWRGGHCWRGAAFFFMLCIVVHILLTIWVYQDIRRRNSGSGIWIIITLMTGLLGAAVYALVRIGEKQA